MRETSTGRTVLGRTPTAPSARAWLTYSSPSCEVYIISGMVAVRGSALIACTAWKPSMPGIRWSMKMTSGRLRCRYSRACSADSAVSTVMACCSSIRLRMTLAERESSTIRARLPVVIESLDPYRVPERRHVYRLSTLKEARSQSRQVEVVRADPRRMLWASSTESKKQPEASKCPTQPRTSAISPSWAKPARARRCWPKPCSRSPAQSGRRGRWPVAPRSATSIHRKKRCCIRSTPRSAASRPRASA